MPTPAELTNSIAQLNTATNTLGDGTAALAREFDALSTRVFALADQISTRMTDAEVAAVKTALDQETNRIDNGVVALSAIAASMSGLATTPTNPVPTPVPEPIPEPLPPTPVP